MAPPAANSTRINAAAPGGGLAFDHALASVPLGPNKKLAGGRDDGVRAAADDDEKTCDPRANKIRQIFTLLRSVAGPLQAFAQYLNLLSGDGEERALIERISKGESIEIPDRESAEYRSLFFNLDKRATLMGSDPTQENYVLEASALASKFAYENRKAAKYLVETGLQGTAYTFFDCRNVFLNQKTTQAIGFVRYEGQLRRATVYVAFRGSELTSPGDWETNFDCGHLTMGANFGKVHKGFMKALGLLSDTGNFDNDFPRYFPWNMNQNLRPAYYTIRSWLLDVFDKLTADQVVLRVVGHSQGGALAILFAAMLLYYREVPSRVSLEVITMGQPRVGDSDFAEWMNSAFLKPIGRPPSLVYKRMVYRLDPVPRIPFDDDPDRKTCYSGYRHFGTCLYYQGWKKKFRLEDATPMPFENFASNIADAGFQEALEDLGEAYNDRSFLRESSFMTQSIRDFLLWPVAFHTITSYLNAARHGQGRPAKRRGLLRALLQYPRKLLEQKAPAASCCNGILNFK